MRINPSENSIKSAELKAAAKQKTDKVTRIVALVVAFVSVYMFIIKILFL